MATVSCGLIAGILDGAVSRLKQGTDTGARQAGRGRSSHAMSRSASTTWVVTSPSSPATSRSSAPGRWTTCTPRSPPPTPCCPPMSWTPSLPRRRPRSRGEVRHPTRAARPGAAPALTAGTSRRGSGHPGAGCQVQFRPTTRMQVIAAVEPGRWPAFGPPRRPLANSIAHGTSQTSRIRGPGRSQLAIPRSTRSLKRRPVATAAPWRGADGGWPTSLRQSRPAPPSACSPDRSAAGRYYSHSHRRPDPS